MAECLPLIKVDGGRDLCAVIFLPNGKHLVSSGGDGVRVWRTEDGQRMATLEVGRVQCLAVSNDGKYIAGGTNKSKVVVWDASTYKEVFDHTMDASGISGVDFSPDATRLVAASNSGAAYVFDIATGKRVQTFEHGDRLVAEKYSPHGDRIAIATQNYSVRVYDSNDGRLLVNIKGLKTPWLNKGLLWFDDHLLVVSDNKIKRINASTGSTLSEWLVPNPQSDRMSCIALSKHGNFIAYSTQRTVTLWDMAKQTQLGLIEHPEGICSIALSPDDWSIAIGGKDGKIIVRSVLCITGPTDWQGEQDARSPTSRDHDNNPANYSTEEPCIIDSPTLRGPDLKIDDAILNLWKCDQLMDAETLLDAAIITRSASHHLLASRALVRARLRGWDAALVDAEMAIEIQPSIMGYIAKSIALVGKGKAYDAYRTCDIAFAPFHSSHVCFLLLIKAIVVFTAREHVDAISRIDNLIATVPFNSTYYIVQAYMYVLVGNSRMEGSDYEGAIESFGRARTQMRHDASRALFIISLISGWKFDNLSTTIEQRLCEAMYAAGWINDAVECFHEMTSKLEDETDLPDDHVEWALDFRQRSSERLAHLGDTAVDAQQYDEAISHYTTILSLDPPSPQVVLIKRSKVFLTLGAWKQALDDANQIIMLDPSSPWGYEMKHAALHKAGEYDTAVDALETMLSKMAQSPDPTVQQHGDKYISPSTTRATIHKIVQRTIRHSPRVLINATTGRLHDKAEQASAFESLPIFNELVSSMTTRTDYVRIKREVRGYFRYVMLSHKWEKSEPLFQQVVRTAVYDLGTSPTHDKLQTFCKIVQDGGFVWAWSDTCCIDKSDHFVLQEALVAMFKWYQGAALTIVFLRGVHSLSQLGALMQSTWNTRAWTLQEYIASNVVHFYTEDWALYLNLQLPNHKESREIISEMEQATGVSAEQLMALRPGLTSIREKLRLASTRQTTLVEDAAYSLLGIFSVAGLPAIYGEGESSLGRLLAHVLTGSGDATILAWTGESGSYNSCLPAYITVFNGPATSHLPAPLPDIEMERIISASHSFDLDVALSLYDCLSKLPAPWFAASRLKLACIAFELPSLSPYRTRSGRVYCADTLMFGTIKIKTKHDLSRMNSLYLVHPWLDSLLEQESVHRGASMEDGTASPTSLHSDDEETFDEELNDDSSSILEPESPSHHARMHLAPQVPVDRETRARRFVARLRQPFGALLITPTGTGRLATPDYRRVAADSLITVRFQENVSLADILENVRTLDIL